MYMSNVHNMRQRLDSLYRSFEGECGLLDSVVSGKEDAYRTIYSPEVERDELRIRDSAGFILMRMQLLSLALGDEMPVLNYPLSKFYGAEDEYLLLQGDSTHCDPVLLFSHQCAEDLPYEVGSPNPNQRMFVVAATPLSGQDTMLLQPFNQMERWTNPRWRVADFYQLIDLRIALRTQQGIVSGSEDDPTRKCAFFTINDVLAYQHYPEDERDFISAHLDTDAVVYWPLFADGELTSARNVDEERQTADHELIYLVNIHRYHEHGNAPLGRRLPLKSLPHCVGAEIFCGLLDIQPTDADAIKYLGGRGNENSFRTHVGNWIHGPKVHPRKCNELIQQSVYGKYISARAQALEIRDTYDAELQEGGFSIFDYVAGPSAGYDEERHLIRTFVLPFTFDGEGCFLVLSFAYLSINSIRCRYEYVSPNGIRGCAESMGEGVFDYTAGASSTFFISADGHAWIASNGTTFFMTREGVMKTALKFDMRLVTETEKIHRPADARYIVATSAMREPTTPVVNVYART